MNVWGGLPRISQELNCSYLYLVTFTSEDHLVALLHLKKEFFFLFVIKQYLAAFKDLRAISTNFQLDFGEGSVLFRENLTGSNSHWRNQGIPKTPEPVFWRLECLREIWKYFVHFGASINLRMYFLIFYPHLPFPQENYIRDLWNSALLESLVLQTSNSMISMLLNANWCALKKHISLFSRHQGQLQTRKRKVLPDSVSLRLFMPGAFLFYACRRIWVNCNRRGRQIENMNKKICKVSMCTDCPSSCTFLWFPISADCFQRHFGTN